MHEGEWSSRLGLGGQPAEAEELMVMRDGEQTVDVFAIEKDGVMKEIILIVRESEEMILMDIWGEIDLKNINQIVEAIPEILSVEVNIDKQKKVEEKKELNEPLTPTKPQKIDCFMVNLQEHAYDSNGLPIYLVILIETMLKYKNMLKLEGIFRKPGSIEDEEDIIEALSKMKDV